MGAVRFRDRVKGGVRVRARVMVGVRVRVRVGVGTDGDIPRGGVNAL